MNDAQIKSLAKHAFPEYRGRKIRGEAKAAISLGNTWWDGGTKYEYRAVRISDGAIAPQSGDPTNPFSALCKPFARLEIPEGFAVVEHCRFCGKDAGLRVYYAAAKALAATGAAELEE